ncbi:MAG: hypothetical protein V1866_03615 [archaeon]
MGILGNIFGFKKSNKSVRLDLFKPVNTGADRAFLGIKGLDAANLERVNYHGSRCGSTAWRLASAQLA